MALEGKKSVGVKKEVSTGKAGPPAWKGDKGAINSLGNPSTKTSSSSPKGKPFHGDGG